MTLNNPPLNVIDIPMMEELRAALEQIEARPEISVIVFAGSERAFSSGVDIAAHTPDKVRGMLADFHSVIRSVVEQQQADDGQRRRHCLGGGAELALVCDIVYASPIRYGDFRRSSWPAMRRWPAWRLSCHCGTEACGGVAADRPHIDWRGGAGGWAGERLGRRSGDAGCRMRAARLAAESGGTCASPRRPSMRGIQCTSTKVWRAPSRFITMS